MEILVTHWHVWKNCSTHFHCQDLRFIGTAQLWLGSASEGKIAEQINDREIRARRKTHHLLHSHIFFPCSFFLSISSWKMNLLGYKICSFPLMLFHRRQDCYTDYYISPVVSAHMVLFPIPICNTGTLTIGRYRHPSDTVFFKNHWFF